MCNKLCAQQKPDILHQIMGPGGPLGSIGAKRAVAGIAALAAKQILGSGGFGSMRLELVLPILTIDTLCFKPWVYHG